MAGAYLDENGNLIYGNVCTTGTSVLTSATLDEEDGKTVIISPISEKWTRLATYCLYGVAYTSEGKGVSIARTFIPGSAVSRPSLVTELAASDYYGRYIMLSWKPTGEEVKGYKVYYKTSESADFEEYTSWDANRLTLPIDSSACKNVSDDDDCPQVEELDKSYARSEINYWFHTDSTKTEVTALDEYNRTDYTFTWTTEIETHECTVPSGTSYTTCAEYDLYGSYYTYDYEYDADLEKYIYTYVWRVNKALETPVTCKSTNYYYEDDATCYEIYLEIGTVPTRSVNYYVLTYTDSTSCTVTNGYFDDNKKCVALKEEFGNYSSINYNYWWYTEEVPIKPEAKSFNAFVTTNNVVSDETSSVKFVVLPYVVVGGDTVLADAVKATRAEYKITTEN